MFQILATGGLASSESQARPNSAGPTAATVDLTDEKDKEEDEEQDKEKDQEEEARRRKW